MAWEIVVGVETHAHLLTRSKAFSGAAVAFGAAPNTQASAVDIALPGTLPVPNRVYVEHAIRFGLAVGGEITRRSVFERKNYFYPDLPKGYQISQFQIPIVRGGAIRFFVDGREHSAALTRAHLEEDAGKSLHEDFHGMSGIDLNRAGVPLLEIVSEPVLRGAAEAAAYARALHALVVWIEICDGNMQEGSFRCDANVSVRKAGATKLGTRCEIKNLNSFRFMEQAIEFEARRQIAILEDGGKVVQETRLFDPDKGETRAMRTKEDAQDYRYFPDPDLLPLVVTEEMIEKVRRTLPESPDVKRDRFVTDFKIPLQTAAGLTTNVNKASYFEVVVKYINDSIRDERTRFKAIRSGANMVVGDLASLVKDDEFMYGRSPVDPLQMARLQDAIANGTISGTMGKELLGALYRKEGTVDELIEKRGLRQISDAGELEKLVDAAIAAGAKQVADYRAGKEKALQSLVGQVMKASKGKADPAQVNEILRRKLKN